MAFVGFSTIEPFAFRAVGGRPGSAWGFADRVRRSVRAAAAQADVVIATFHWGIERDFVESAQQRSLAAVALAAGATGPDQVIDDRVSPARIVNSRPILSRSEGLPG